MPGRTASRASKPGTWRSTRAASSGRSGRGPTRLISPRSTFTACGSSSRCQRRSTRPTRVTRGSAGGDQAGPESRSAPSAMVRNLSMPKTRPWRPSRACRRITGPGPSRRTASATAATSGIQAGSSRTAPRASAERSKGRFQPSRGAAGPDPRPVRRGRAGPSRGGSGTSFGSRPALPAPGSPGAIAPEGISRPGRAVPPRRSVPEPVAAATVTARPARAGAAAGRRTDPRPARARRRHARRRGARSRPRGPSAPPGTGPASGPWPGRRP